LTPRQLRKSCGSRLSSTIRAHGNGNGDSVESAVIETYP
jgi:hypothetical protein